jgi:hypothetical protein
MKSTVVLNLNDEYFIQNIVNNVIDVESLDVPTTQSQDDYASVKTKKQQKRKQVEEATAGRDISFTYSYLICLQLLLERKSREEHNTTLILPQ